MSRPLRIIFKDAYYHVINRGRKRDNIFHNDHDYQFFLHLLKTESIKNNVKIAAYCLMSNHYHILVHTPQANLPCFMRQINGIYAQYYNRKYKTDGALFNGRYKSYVVHEDNYLLRLIRYIHLNPVKAKIVSNPQNYEWMTHKYYLRGGTKSSEWLMVNDVLNKYGAGGKNKISAYKKHLREGIDSEIEHFYTQKKHSAILGNTQYQDDIAQSYLKKFTALDCPEERIIRGELIFRKIKKEILSSYAVTEKELMTTKRGKTNIILSILVYLTKELTQLKHMEIAGLIKNLNKSSIKTCYYRFNLKINDDPQLRHQIERIKANIIKV